MSQQNIPDRAPSPLRDDSTEGAPTMSTAETTTGIFFEPGRTFEALRVHPRFLVAGLFAIAAFMSFYLTYIQRVGYENLVSAEISQRLKDRDDVPPEQKAQMENIQKKGFVKAIRLGSPALVFAIVFAAGAAIYMLGTNLMGGRMNYKQALAVWVYSTMPPLILMTLLNFVLLYINPPQDEAEIVQGLERGLVRANPGAFVDATAHPVLATALGVFDLLSFFGLFLAALGLRKVARLKSGSAWTIVLALWGFGVLLRIVLAMLFGRPS